MIKQYKNILVPVDGSKESEDALEEGLRIAERNSAKLTVIYVRDVNQTIQNPYGADLVFEDLNEEEKLIKSNVEKVNKSYKESNFVSMAGYPKHTITKYAKDKNIDLIVIGATGKNSFERILVGSVTSYVLNHAHCNLLIVR